MAAKKKVAQGNSEARLSALRDDFASLQGDLKGLYGDVSSEASSRATAAMQAAEEVADRAMLLAERRRSVSQGFLEKTWRCQRPLRCA